MPLATAPPRLHQCMDISSLSTPSPSSMGMSASATNGANSNSKSNASSRNSSRRHSLATFDEVEKATMNAIETHNDDNNDKENTQETHTNVDHVEAPVPTTGKRYIHNIGINMTSLPLFSLGKMYMWVILAFKTWLCPRDPIRHLSCVELERKLLNRHESNLLCPITRNRAQFFSTFCLCPMKIRV
jgi:hypothetical protein